MPRFIFLIVMVGSFAGPFLASKSNGKELAEKVLYKASGCVACHRMTLDHIGPSMLAVSQKYANDPNGASMVLDSLKNGARGKWGNNVMPPQSHVSDQNLQLLTNWALAIKDSPNLKGWQKEELVTQESNTVLSTDQPLEAKYSLPENRIGTVVQTLDQPVVYRTYLPGASSRAIAVGLPGGISYAFDAKLCKLLYFWEGGFLDFEKSWTGHGGWYSKLMGTKIFTAPPHFPLRLGNSEDIRKVKFNGYRMIHGQPEFLYRIDQLDVRHQITFQPEEYIIVQKFFLSKTENKIFFIGGENRQNLSSEDGEWRGNALLIDPVRQEAFTIFTQVIR